MTTENKSDFEGEVDSFQTLKIVTSDIEKIMHQYKEESEE